MKRNIKKAINELVRKAKHGEGGYAYRGRNYKTKPQLKTAVVAEMEREAAENKKLRRRRPVKPLRIDAETIKQMKESRDEREAARRELLSDWAWRRDWFIAVNKYGFGTDTRIANAIRNAQRNVPVSAKPSQMAIYRHPTAITPTGFVTWPNGARPVLVGLTNTHQGWQELR